MNELVREIVWSSIYNLFELQQNIYDFTPETGETEWNLTHHLAFELHKYLFWLDHDVELRKINYEDKRPDIIFHKRGINAQNFLIVEVKRNKNIQVDIDKIKDYWMQPNLMYRFGTAIRFDSLNSWNGFVISRDNEDNNFNFDQGSFTSPLPLPDTDKQNEIIEFVRSIEPNDNNEQAKLDEIDKMVTQFYSQY